MAVYSDADVHALHVRMADAAYPIGPAPATDSYLRIDRVLEAARRRALMPCIPGYGFLAENADFAQACIDAGLVFVGPPPQAMRALGLKTEARKLMQAAGSRLSRAPSNHWRVSTTCSAAHKNRLPRRAQGRSRRRRQGLAHGARAGPPRSGVPPGDERGWRGIRQPRRVPRTRHRAAASHRNADSGRRARSVRLARRTGLLHSAPTPEGPRGVTVAGRPRCAARWARWRCAPRRPPAIPMPERSSFCWRRTGISTSSK